MKRYLKVVQLPLDFSKAGENIIDVIDRAVQLAQKDNCIYQVNCNGMWISARPNSSKEWLYQMYDENISAYIKYRRRIFGY